MMATTDEVTDDQIARIRAEGDQAKASVRDLAERLGTFRKTLIIEGFAAEFADEACADLLNAILGKQLIEAHNDGDDE